jgi:hypothetical protein
MYEQHNTHFSVVVLMHNSVLVLYIKEERNDVLPKAQMKNNRMLYIIVFKRIVACFASAARKRRE